MFNGSEAQSLHQFAQTRDLSHLQTAADSLAARGHPLAPVIQRAVKIEKMRPGTAIHTNPRLIAPGDHADPTVGLANESVGEQKARIHTYFHNGRPVTSATPSKLDEYHAVHLHVPLPNHHLYIESLATKPEAKALRQAVPTVGNSPNPSFGFHTLKPGEQFRR